MEVEGRLQKDMESLGTNHDAGQVGCTAMAYHRGATRARVRTQTRVTGQGQRQRQWGHMTELYDSGCAAEGAGHTDEG